MITISEAQVWMAVALISLTWLFAFGWHLLKMAKRMEELNVDNDPQLKYFGEITSYLGVGYPTIVFLIAFGMVMQPVLAFG